MLMGLVSITTVFSFESVGAILVVGLLTIPPATAYLLTDRLKTMLWLSSVIGIVSVIIGYYGALWLNSSISGGMVVASGLILFVTLIVVKIKKRMPSRVEAVK
jgi:manganese/zinc/iron transport system permease protein